MNVFLGIVRICAYVIAALYILLIAFAAIYGREAWMGPFLWAPVGVVGIFVSIVSYISKRKKLDAKLNFQAIMLGFAIGMIANVFINILAIIVLKLFLKVSHHSTLSASMAPIWFTGLIFVDILTCVLGGMVTYKSVKQNSMANTLALGIVVFVISYLLFLIFQRTYPSEYAIARTILIIPSVYLGGVLAKRLPDKTN